MPLRTWSSLVEFAHKAIDNGADVFIGHGVHTIRGVEIYGGKPIFYGVNSFYYQDRMAIVRCLASVFR